MAINPKEVVNSLSPAQVDIIINYMFKTDIKKGPMSGRKMLERVPGRDIIPGHAIYMTNYTSSPYPRFWIPNELYNQMEVKPLKRDFHIHQLFWRWLNGGALCRPEKHISHLICYKGPNPFLKSENFLLVREEDRNVNESRKYCWEEHPELDFLRKGKCPHKPKCRLVDWDVWE